MLKTDKYYDVQCDFCGRNMSTDFFTGMAPTSKEAVMWAKDVGFRTRLGKNICPICIEEQNKTKGES